MTKTGKISSYQLFLMMAVSRVLSTLTFIPKAKENAGLSDYFTASIIGWALMPLVFLPVFVYIKKSRNKSIIEHFPKAEKPLSAALVILLLFMAVFTLARLNLFVSTVFFPDRDSTFLIIVTAVAVCYCSFLSIEPIMRAGSMLFIALSLSLLIIMLSLTDKTDINYLTPVLSNGAIPFFKLIFSVIIRTAEPLFLILLLPKTEGNIKKGFLLWIILTGISLSLLTFLLTVTLGETSLRQLFPFHSMAQLAGFGVIERMDALLTGVWIFSAFLRLCIIMYLAKDIIRNTFTQIKESSALAVCGIIVVLAVLSCDQTVMSFANLFSLHLRGILFAIFLIILPITALVKIRLKEKGQK